MRYSIYLILLFCFSCTIFQTIKVPEDKIGKLSDSNTKLKIALVGFYPVTVSYRYEGRYFISTASLDYDHPMKDAFPIGQPVEQIPTSSIDSTIPAARCYLFVSNYLELVKKTGITELNKVVDFDIPSDKEELDKTKCLVKKRDVDYYIVGINGPSFRNNRTGIRLLFNLLLSVSTAFTFPIFEKCEAYSIFMIYDSKLNLIKTVKYDKDMTAIAS